MPVNRNLAGPWAAGERSKYLLVIITFCVVGANWYTNEILPGRLITGVDPVTLIPVFETRWLYAWLLLITGSFPILFGFLPQLKFYKVWPQVLIANLPVTLFFIAWDIFFTKKEVWAFSMSYTSGMKLFHLPWEEWAFFIIIPAACIFIYWSLNHFIKHEPFARWEKQISIGLILFLVIMGVWTWDQIYTATTSLLSAAFLLFHILFIPPGYRGRFYLAFMVSCIPFLAVNGILTGGYTTSPVVMYHPEEYIGLRVGTIPVDDFGYSFLMLFANITLFEALVNRKPT